MRKTASPKPDISKIDTALVGELIAFLEPFDSHTDKLQGQKYPTMQYVTMAFDVLLDHCQPLPTDSQVMRCLREKAYRLLCEKVVITMDHKIATFLWPPSRDLLMYPKQEDKDEVIFKSISLL